MSHTPGPWFVSPEQLDDYDNVYFTVGTFPIGPGTDHPKNDTHYEDTICEVWDGNHDGKANAELIAQAPLLADRIKQLEAVLRLFNEGCRVMSNADAGCMCYGCQVTRVLGLKDCPNHPSLDHALACHRCNNPKSPKF